MRITIRARLTIVYGGLFLLAGLALITVTYLLVGWRVPGGTVTAGSYDPNPSAAASEPPTFSTVVDDTWSDALHALLTGGLVALLIVGSIAVAIGWLLAGRLLRPLQTVTETARRIADRPSLGLHRRIGLTAPHDELKELADTFDVMLDRLDRSFDNQRRFIANASHELRTPLAVNRALIEVAVVQRPETAKLGATLLDVNARHEKLIDGLLLLARSEHEVIDRSYVDLADIVERIADDAGAGPGADAGAGPGADTGAGPGVVATPGSAPTMGNAALLERLVQNLVDNAVRYNVSGGWVRISSATHDGTAVLRVCNTGPVVPGYEVAGLFEPFRRYPRDRPAGSTTGVGLGLSIVRAIATAHGGDVRAEPNPGGGLIVTVALPGTA